MSLEWVLRRLLQHLRKRDSLPELLQEPVFDSHFKIWIGTCINKFASMASAPGTIIGTSLLLAIRARGESHPKQV